MSPKEKQEFETWYATQVDVEFNLKEELIAYCKYDMDLLNAGCQNFVKEFQFQEIRYVDLTSENPWSASMAHTQ